VLNMVKCKWGVMKNALVVVVVNLSTAMVN